MCQAMRMGHSESEIAASAAQFNIQADDARYVLTRRGISLLPELLLRNDLMKKLAGLRPHGGDCRQVRRVEMNENPRDTL